jgi:hypothetical protein
MKTRPLTGSIGRLIAQRSNLVRELSDKLERLKQEEGLLAENLLAIAPESIQQWLTDDCIITNLFEYGQAQRKIVFNEKPFGDHNQVKDLIKTLNKAWKGLVVVKLNKKPETHRVGVTFTVLH